MLKIRKNILYDENNNPIAVQIPFEDFKILEEIIENYGLSKMMEETEEDFLSYQESLNYYKNFNNEKGTI